MPDPFTYTVDVTAPATDAQGHANDVQCLPDAAVAAAEALDLGASLTRSLAATRVVRSPHVDYGRPCPATG